MDDARRAALAALVDTSNRHLHGIASRSESTRLAEELARLNDAVLSAARGALTPFDQPGDFGQALLRHADPANDEG